MLSHQFNRNVSNKSAAGQDLSECALNALVMADKRALSLSTYLLILERH